MTADPIDPRTLRHELRTPLNQIIGYAELLEEEVVEAGHHVYVSDLRRIQSAARRLHGRIDEAIGLRSQTAPAPVPDDGSEWTLDAATGDGERILVVDDSAENREMLARRLALHGFAATTASSGPRALHLLSRQAFDLVLLDVMMPVMGGLEVLERIRQTTSIAELPVVMATARHDSADIVAALEAGANDYVTKPLDFPVVLARVHGQLALKRARDEIQRLADALEVRNRFIRHTFGRYVSDEVAESLLETPEGLVLGGELRRVTVLMADLRGFTPLAETMAPSAVVTLLNNYLGAMAEIILDHRGTIDEFIGDGILAVFGAPLSGDDDALRALACAVEMQRAIEGVNAFNGARGLPIVEMGVAINTGDAVVGNIGSQKRAKYGVVGSVVNLCARIESCTVGGQVLTSTATLAEAGPSVGVGDARQMAVKGAGEPITIYELQSVGDRRIDVVDEASTALATPLAIGVMLVDDAKRVGDARHPALLTALSARGALLRPEAIQLDLFACIRIEIPGTGVNVYASIVGAPDASGCQPIRFTSLPTAAAAVLAQLRRDGQSEVPAASRTRSRTRSSSSSRL